MQRDRLAVTRYPVNEIFPTIQGEAYYTGTPSLFVRLQGCAVGCPWCDTKHTWSLDHCASFEAIVGKTTDDRTYCLATADELAQHASGYSAHHVVLTGGEPCDYDLTELAEALVAVGKSVQIETSGTAEVRSTEFSWVTVSPKIGMPGGKQVLDQALSCANEIKMPVGKMADIEQLDGVLLRMKERRLWKLNGMPLVWLQPLSQSQKATALCVSEATKRGWRVSVQTHKYLGVR